MDYRKLTVDTWNQLTSYGDSESGYQSIWLAINNNTESALHIFKDESGRFHVAIEDKSAKQDKIEDPDVNGLSITVNRYKFQQGHVKNLIDITCNLTIFLEEFTEITKEIAKDILETNESPVTVVNRVLRNWKIFWSVKNKQRLSEERQIGLLCELLILKELSKINAVNAINSWRGPFGEKHDFIFSDWSFEVKGTMSRSQTHIINGIDQLEPFGDKAFAFISFVVSRIASHSSICIPHLISDIESLLVNRPELILKFNEALLSAGYNPLFADDYREFNLEVIASKLYLVDDEFPKLTNSSLNGALDNRVSNITYTISLGQTLGTSLENLQWGNYLY